MVFGGGLFGCGPGLDEFESFGVAQAPGGGGALRWCPWLGLTVPYAVAVGEPLEMGEELFAAGGAPGEFIGEAGSR